MTSSALCPSIATYQMRQGRRAPGWLAVYVDGGMLLPRMFQGASQAEVEVAARDWWAQEQIAVAKARAARGEKAA